MIDDKLKTNFKQFREEMKEDYGKIANVALIEAGREMQDTGFIENNPKIRDLIRKQVEKVTVNKLDDELIEIYYVDKSKQKDVFFKIDTGAPKTFAGEKFVKDYLEKINMRIEDLHRTKTNDVFSLGDTSYMTLGQVTFPVYLKNYEGGTEKKVIICRRTIQ